MIVIDMDMPTDCVDCPIDCFPYGAEDTDYDTTNRPSCCPIKCDIEDVKAEIEQHSTLSHLRTSSGSTIGTKKRNEE